MAKYKLTSSKFVGEILLDYTSYKYLKDFSIQAELNQKQHAYLLENLPIHELSLAELAKKSESLNIEEIEETITFDMFWNKYSHKVDKILAEKEWNKLNKKDQALAYHAIGIYDAYLKRKNIEKIYPVRYLKNRRFETNYKEL